MKISRFIPFWLLLLPFTVFGQQSFGIESGVTLSNVRVNGIGNFMPDPDLIARPMIQMNYEYPISEFISVRTGLGFQQRGFSVRSDFDVNLFNIDIPIGVRAVTEADYLTVPLELKINLAGDRPVSPYISGGLTTSYATGARIREFANVLVDIRIGEQKINMGSNLFNRWEIGGKLTAGLDVALPTGKIFLEASYHTGFTNILNDPILAVRLNNQNIGLGLGYRYTF